MPKLYDIYELPERNFPLSFKLIDFCQREDPFLQAKLICVNYQNGYFRGGRNTIEVVTYRDKIVIPQQLQRYLVKLYQNYLLHPVLDRMEAVIHQHL